MRIKRPVDTSCVDTGNHFSFRSYDIYQRAAATTCLGRLSIVSHFPINQLTPTFLLEERMFKNTSQRNELSVTISHVMSDSREGRRETALRKDFNNKFLN